MTSLFYSRITFMEQPKNRQTIDILFLPVIMKKAE